MEMAILHAGTIPPPPALFPPCFITLLKKKCALPQPIALKDPLSHRTYPVTLDSITLSSLSDEPVDWGALTSVRPAGNRVSADQVLLLPDFLPSAVFLSVMLNFLPC